MDLRVKKLNINIWGLALGYLAFYIPYSALTKALSKGLVPGAPAISGFEMLPAVVVGTNIVLITALTLMGWWSYAGRRSFFGYSIPFPTNKWTLFSGIATAFIILTTTLAYSFEGISIVFAALLMRGGVLMMSPVIDTIFKRRVHWYSWVALFLTFCALMILFAEKGGFFLTFLAALNIGLYLSGYMFRLQYMTRIAKSFSQDTNYKFFVEEMIVAMIAIMILPGIFPIIGYGNGISDLWNGWMVFLQPNILLPSLLIGSLYGCLYLFGTRIYLDQRENTFCIPVNRCASLLAGVGASALLSFIYGQSFVSSTQLLSASVLLVAILFLSAPGFMKLFGINQKLRIPEQRTYVFVCDHNRSRSPIAEAVCISYMEKKLKKLGLNLKEAGIKIISAGINSNEDSTLSKEALQTLKELNIETTKTHASLLTKEMVKSADMIFCMTQEQRHIISAQFLEATFKCIVLDPDNNLPELKGQEVSSYKEFANNIQALINHQIEARHIIAEPSYF